MNIENISNWIAVWSTYLEFQCELLLPVTRSRGSAILMMSLKYSETHSTHGGACEARRGPQHENHVFQTDPNLTTGGEMPLCTAVAGYSRMSPAGSAGMSAAN